VASEDRSVIAFEHYQKGSERFEYFVVGVSMALCAYVAQTLKPERLGLSPYTLEVIGVALIVASIFLGFKRIETVTLGALVNHEILHLGEKRGTFISGLQSQPGGFINQLSGEYWKPKDIEAEVARINKILPLRQKQMKEIQSKMRKLYTWRNRLLAAGFMALFVSKILAGYFHCSL
jgi:hypothetical protein